MEFNNTKIHIAILLIGAFCLVMFGIGYWVFYKSYQEHEELLTEIVAQAQNEEEDRFQLLMQHFDVGRNDIVLLPSDKNDIYEVTIDHQGQFYVKFNDDFKKINKVIRIN